MKKSTPKGFTLIELIAVLVILAVILAIAVPSITGVIRSAKERACVLDAGMMEKAAKTLVQVEGLVIKEGEQKTIAIETLKDSKYLSDVLDPEDQKTPCEGYVIVSNEDGTYSYHAALKCSNTCQSADYNDDLDNNTSPLDLDTVEKNGDQYFEGANPNNWVKFGRMDENDKRGIMWRIIKIDNSGIKMVYEGIENGSLKPLEDGRALIDGSMGVPWDSTGKNKWNEPASLVGKLDNWLSHIYITDLQDYVSAATWKVGGVPYQAPTNLRTFLTYQDIDSTNSGGNFSGLTNYKSVMGTINAVDFMYTSDNEECAYSYKETGSDNECAYNVDGSLNNFLQKERYHYWTLNARSDSTNRAWNITNSGLIGSSLTNLSAVSIRPVLNLKLNTEFLAGTGTIEDPYILEDYMIDIWNSPTITLNGDSTVYVRQYDPYVDEGATAVDEEDGDLSSKIVTTGAVDTNKPGEYTIEYNVSDVDGNKAIPVTRKVIVVERDKPIITLNGDNPTYVTITKTYTELGATAYDINYGDISSSIVTNGTVDTTTLGTYYITYNVTNQDGIKAPEVTRKVIVKVPTPKITLNGPNPTLVDIGTSYTEEGATALDEVDGDITTSIQKTIERYNDTLRKWETVSSIDTSKITTFHIKYSVTNSFGVNTFVNRTVNIVKADGPNITYTPDGGTASKKVYETKIDVTKTKYNIDNSSLKYFTYNSYSRFSSTNFESYFRTPFSSGSTVKLSSGTGYYYVYAIAKDIYGNTRMKSSQSFRIDNSAPVITMRSGISRILLHKTYSDAGATAYDKYYDGDLTSKMITTSNVDTEHEGIYFVTYEVADSAGNNTTAKRRVEVYHPTPQIYLNGGSSLRLLYGTPYVEQGARAIDEVDGDITSKIVITGSVDIHKEGTYTITYSATNSSGHTGTRTRTVEVYIPNPVITILGSNPAKVMIHSPYSDAGATATDTLDGTLTNKIFVTGTINVDVAGTYFVTYSVTNNLGKNTTVKRTVVVYVPTPKITILGNNPYPLFKGQSYSDAGATAQDDLDGNLTDKIEATGTVNTNVAGTYPIKYAVVNSEGGKSEATRNVVVRKSTTTITLTGGSIKLLRGTPYVEPGYTAYDELDGDITSDVTITSNINPNIAGTYQVTYSVTNSGGDTKTVTRSVTIRKPDLKITLIGDSSISTLRGTPYEEAGYTAIDEVDGDITSKVVVTSNINPNMAGTYQVTYSITNSGGDNATATRTVVVRKPLLTITLNGSSTVEMLKGGTYTEPGFTATDEVDGDITNKVTLLSNLNPTTLGKYTIEYRVVNSGGDEKAVIRNIVVRDPKVIITLNGDSTINLSIGSVYSDAGATASDELLGDVSNKISTTLDLNPNVLGTYYVNYEVISSGVKATAKRTIKVVPLPGPVITFDPNGNSSYATNQHTTVTISKGERDVDNSSFKYLWKTDLTKPTESDFTTSFDSGDTIYTPANVTGKYYLFVLAKDVYNNVSILGSNGFNVDNTVPVITLIGNKVIETPIDGVYTEQGATVIEADSGLDDNDLVITSNLVPGIIGTYQVTYNATDKAGNKALPVVRTVSVIEASLKDAPGEDFVPLYDASYFIGSNAANWVEFGNAADNVYDYIPIMWRIIKADDNGIKIIYEGVKSGSSTTQNGTIGKYQWDSTDNTWNRPSTIRTNLNAFYSDFNEEDKDTLTKKINWCVGKINSPYGINNFKNDECSVLGDNLSPIGLANSADYILTSKDPCGGYNQASCGTNNFLKKNYNYFTINGDVSSNVAVFIINSNGGLTRDEATKTMDVRPVINLRPDVLIIGGEGTFDNPYKLNSRVPMVDNEAPMITFTPSTITGKVDDRKVEVVVTDELTGVNNDSLKYVWTTSSTQPSIDTITNSFVNGDKIEPQTDLAGKYYLWVLAKDRKGNQAISKGGPYLIDNEPPVITMNGSSSIKIAVGSVYSDAGSTATDNVDGNITSKIQVVSNVIPTIIGTYKVTYNVSDTAGNAATEVVRTVIVYETTPPTVTFNPNGIAEYSRGTNTKVTVTDNESVDTSSLKYQWTTSTSVPSEGSFTSTFTNNTSIATPPSVSGTYYLWILAKDNNGNTTITKSNGFKIDNIAPVIVLIGNQSVNINLNSVYSDPGATATDDMDGNITNNIITTSNVSTAVLGTYQITYNVTDSAGNIAIEVVRNVSVVKMDDAIFTFTNATATGKNGPTQTQLNNEYTGTQLSGMVTASNGIQLWTVPTTGAYTIDAYGAKGGSTNVSTTYAGGNGARMKGTFNLTAGQQLKILVGQMGGTFGYTGGGGGGTFVAFANNTPIIVAGGGGGGGNSGGAGYSAVTSVNGTTGYPGYPAGVNGYGSTSTSNGGWGQAGAGYYGNGNGREASASWGNGAVALGFTNGGIGAQQSGTTADYSGVSCVGAWGGFGGGASGSCNGGGGGGGYSGGAAGGGAGGSYNSGTSQSNTAGYNTGQGKVIIIISTPPTVYFNQNGNSTYEKSSGTKVVVTDNAAVDDSSLKYQWTTSTTAPSEASFTTAFANNSTINTPNGATGTYYLWILAKDAKGNTTIFGSNAFYLDNTAPVITLNGVANINVFPNTVYSDAGATASDNVDGNVSSKIVTTSDVNTAIKGTYHVTYNVTDNAGNVATQVVRTVTVDNVYNFAYTGNPQSFVAPITGQYKLETWGASAGDRVDYNGTSDYYGGRGGYATGTISLTAGQVVYIYVGGVGNGYSGTNAYAVRPGGYNGGGAANGSATSHGTSGGGATDMRVGGTALTNRVIVAGGGGGVENCWGPNGGYGGGTTGGGTSYAGGGTQSAGGAVLQYAGSAYPGTFGQGGSGNSTCASGGGGGYYGGAGAYGGSSGGGSSYIGGVTYGQTIAGNASMTSPSGSAETGHSGSGYAKIHQVSALAVAFDRNGNSTYETSTSTGVSVTNDDGIDNSSLKYQWTTSTTAPIEASFTTTFTNNSTINTPNGVSGNYYLWILAKAANGTIAVFCSNIFHLDNTAPVIALNGGASVNITVGSVYNDAGATATDNVDGNISNKIVTTSDVNTSIKGTYHVTYNVTDNAGNIATQVTRTVHVDVIYDFAYTGNYQSFTVPFTGQYKLETWGASAGDRIDYSGTSDYYGGRGGYATGTISLTAGQVIYVYVGGAGNGYSGANAYAVRPGGYNGGGAANGSSTSHGTSGGGATDIRIGGTALTNRVIVAGGGGGVENCWGPNGGYGGGTTGGGTSYAGGGTQSAGGAVLQNPSYAYAGTFGQGGSGNSTCASGGGGGYYGGAGAYGGSSGGGSSYIAGVTGGQTIAGNTSMTSPSGIVETGHTGNGYARMTLISN